MRRNSLETIKTLISDRSSPHHTNDDSDSSSSLEGSILSLGKASSGHSSPSIGVPRSEFRGRGRCRSPTRNAKRGSCRHQSPLGSSDAEIDDHRDPGTPHATIAFPIKDKRLPNGSSMGRNNFTTPVSAAKLCIPDRRMPANSNPFLSLPFRSPSKKKVRSFHPLGSPTPPQGTAKLSLRLMVSPQATLGGKSTERSLETLRHAPTRTRRKPSLDYSRLLPEVTPPSPLGLYEMKRQREEKDEIIEESFEDYHFDDDELSDITCSPAEATSARLSDESRRWKSELVLSASQLSLATMPKRSSSPGRECRSSF